MPTELNAAGSEAVADVAQDTAVNTTVDETVDQTADDAAADATVDATQDDAANGDDQADQNAQDIVVDGRTIPQQYRELFKADRALKAMWFENREMKEMFPGGIPEIREIHQVFADLGGREGLDRLKTSGQELDGIAQMLQAGDPNLVQRMVATSSEGFARLAPQVMTAWHQVDPEGCNATLCGVIASTLRDGGFDAQLDRASLLMEVGRTEDAMKVLTGLKEWAGKFEGVASTPRQQVQQQGSKTNERDAQLAEREQQQFNREVGFELVNGRTKIFDEALAPYLNGRDVDADKRELINNEMLRRVEANLSQDKAFGQKWQSALANKDRDALLRLSQSKLKEVAPEVAKTVARLLIGAPVQKAPVKQAAKPAQVQQKPAQKTSVYADPVKDKIAEIFGR